MKKWRGEEPVEERWLDMKQQRGILSACVHIITWVDRLLMGDPALILLGNYLLNQSIFPSSINQIKLQPTKEYETIYQQKSLNYKVKCPQVRGTQWYLLWHTCFEGNKLSWLRATVLINTIKLSFPPVFRVDSIPCWSLLSFTTVCLSLGSSHFTCVKACDHVNETALF